MTEFTIEAAAFCVFLYFAVYTMEWWWFGLAIWSFVDMVLAWRKVNTR